MARVPGEKCIFLVLFVLTCSFSAFIARPSVSQIRYDKVIPGENLGSTMIDENLIPKMIELKVLFVTLADNDGNMAPYFSKSEAQEQIDYANQVYNKHGIEFVIDPSSGFTSGYSASQGTVKDTHMNHECPAFEGKDMESVKTQMKGMTQKDLNKDGKYDWKDKSFLCNLAIKDAKRAAYAIQFPDKIVIFIRGGNDAEVYYDEKLGHWILDESAARAYSWKDMYYVASLDNAGDASVPHEIGHYLHLPHTNIGGVNTVEKAKEEIKNYILKHEKESEFNPQTEGLNVFDNDGISDTPPDPGGKIFESVYGAECPPGKETIPVDVTVKSKAYHFILAPDMKNIMSYANCLSPAHITLGQRKVVKKALFEGNRQPLVRPELVSCYKKKGIDQGLLLGKQRKEQTVSEVEKLIKKRLGIIESCLNGSKNPYLKVDVKNPPKIKLPLNQLPPPSEMD